MRPKLDSDVWNGCRILLVVATLLTAGTLAGCSGYWARRQAAQALAHLSLIRTAHYAIFTSIHNARERRMLGQVLEADYARFKRLVPGAAPALPLHGYVFADRTQWAMYTRRAHPVLAPIYLRIIAGGYTRKRVFALYRLTPSEMFSVAAHEAWHQFSYASLKDHLPAWLDEGLASQNEAIAWHDGQPVFEPWLNYPRWHALKQAAAARQLWPLKKIITTQAGYVVTRGPQRIATYYGQIWSLSLFLEHSRYRPRLLRLLEAARRGRLTRLLRQAGLTAQDIAAGTVSWNQRAGPIFMRAYLTPKISTLDHAYRAFVKRLVSTWPPPQARRRYPIHWWKGAGPQDIATALKQQTRLNLLTGGH